MHILHNADEMRLLAKQDFVLVNAVHLRSLMLEQFSDLDNKPVVLDLSHIQQMDSSGVQLIFGLYQTCKGKGRSLSIEVPSQPFLKMLQLLKLDRLLDIREVMNHE